MKEDRQGLASLLLLGGYSDFTGSWEIFPSLLWHGGSSFWRLTNQLLLRDLIFTLMLSGHPEPKIQLSRVAWQDSLGPYLLGWGGLFGFTSCKYGQQCGAISRQDKADYFLGFSFPSCAVTPRPKCFVEIIFNFCVVEPVVWRLVVKGFPFLSVN